MPELSCSRLCRAPGTSPMESARSDKPRVVSAGRPTERALKGRAPVMLRAGVDQESVAEAGRLGPALALACMQLRQLAAGWAGRT